MIAFGTGTGVEGQVIPTHGGLCIDLSQMDRILGTHAEDQDCRVQAGVTRNQLNQSLRHSGLFFPVDPGADASLGGMAATRASGTNAVRYGTIRENVMGLTVVLANGEIIRTGTRARKSSAGYDLTHLMLGSEGTLGIITEVQLKLHPIPEKIAAARVGFPSVEKAVTSVIEIIQSGVPIARIELLDQLAMHACNRYQNLEAPAQPTLFLEFHGSPKAVSEQIDTVAAIIESHQGSDFAWATTTEQRQQLWQARHNALYAARAMEPDREIFTTDVCVPISRLAECIEATREDLEQAGLTAPIVGHVGDGNFHVLILVDPNNPEHMQQVEAVNHAMILRALEMGGTCTGEHGIGLGKQQYMATEHGNTVALMRRLKSLFDPNNLLNPGKLLPQENDPAVGIDAQDLYSE